jgi:hypothetical protein
MRVAPAQVWQALAATPRALRSGEGNWQEIRRRPGHCPWEYLLNLPMNA